MAHAEVELTEAQMARLRDLSRTRQVPVSDLVSAAVDNLLSTHDHPGKTERQMRLRSLSGCFHSGLNDLSKNHDAYLEDSFEQ